MSEKPLEQAQVVSITPEVERQRREAQERKKKLEELAFQSFMYDDCVTTPAIQQLKETIRQRHTEGVPREELLPLVEQMTAERAKTTRNIFENWKKQDPTYYGLVVNEAASKQRLRESLGTKKYEILLSDINKEIREIEERWKNTPIGYSPTVIEGSAVIGEALERILRKPENSQLHPDVLGEFFSIKLQMRRRARYEDEHGLDHI